MEIIDYIMVSSALEQFLQSKEFLIKGLDSRQIWYFPCLHLD